MGESEVLKAMASFGFDSAGMSHGLLQLSDYLFTGCAAKVVFFWIIASLKRPPKVCHTLKVWHTLLLLFP